MTKDEASQWLQQLADAVMTGRLTKMRADDDVFAEMEGGDHDAETETMYYNFTRSDIGELK